MRFIKFSLLLSIVYLSHPSYALERFTPKACLDKFFKLKIVNKGPLFGLFSHEMLIDKKHCLITVHHKKYLSKEWKVDVCREPIHMKISSATGGEDVAKKDTPCFKPDKSKDTSDFCAQYFEVMEVIQDDGLIFAEGDRDNLDEDHGKTYCTYLLLKKYLADSIVFSRYRDVEDIFEESAKGQSTAIEVAPVKIESTPLVEATKPAEPKEE